MRCKHCESILWKQPAAAPGSARCCSECGTPYRPSDFEFVRGKVRFECPHCATGFYGTSPRGHLEPPEFECPTCLNRIHMDECVVQAEVVAEESNAVVDRTVPWLTKRGLLARWFGTVLLGLGEPQSISARLPGQERVGAAMLFLAVQSWIAVAPYLLCCGSVGFVGPLAGGGATFVITSILTSIGIGLVAAPAVAFLLSLVAVCGARLASRGNSPSFARDLEIVCYASGPVTLTAIPFYGAPIVLWWFVAACIAIVHARPTGSRGLAAFGAAAGFAGLLAVALALAIIS